MTSSHFMRVIGYMLLGVHFVLGVWAIGGFFEMLSTKIFWKPFTNPEFPNWLLVFHWSSTLFASSVFIFGYFTRWDKTLPFMSIAYGLMATVCGVETFGYMKSTSKYWAMGAEYASYILILLILYKSQYFIEFFHRRTN